MQSIKSLFKWPSVVFLVISLLPAAMLVFIIVTLILRSTLAIQTVGWGGLFSTQISGIFTSNKGLYGLIPAMWGTFLIVLVSIGIAAPVALAMAILANEFNIGFLGNGLRAVLGALSGIPTIVYALMAAVILTIFVQPKFCGPGVEAGQYPIDMRILPYYTSTLIGGIMLSLLIIPFLAPLFDDALKDVPTNLKEASHALGATRWYSLRKVILPYASPSLVSAISLGILKAMGDVVIVGLLVGWEYGLPQPLIDILEPVAPLTSTGAGFSGGIAQALATPLRQSVGYFAGLLLLVMALAILILAPLVQKKLKKEFQ